DGRLVTAEGGEAHEIGAEARGAFGVVVAAVDDEVLLEFAGLLQALADLKDVFCGFGAGKQESAHGVIGLAVFAGVGRLLGGGRRGLRRGESDRQRSEEGEEASGGAWHGCGPCNEGALSNQLPMDRFARGTSVRNDPSNPRRYFLFLSGAASR